MTRFPDPHRSRAVLIGASRYHGEGDLPEIPAVRANLTDLEDALVGVSTGTLASHSCAVVAEPTSVADVGNIITAACREAIDLLLMYYAGHGLVDEHGRLHLALSSTDPAQLRWTALPFETLREEIASSPASTRVLVLDCCFSGRAIDTMTAAQSMTTGQIDITGTYTLTSTTANALSYAPQGDKHTAFTGALLTQLNTPGALTLDELFRRADHSLAIQGAPRPQRRVVNAAGDLALFKAPLTHPRPAQIASPSAADDTPDAHPVPTNQPGTTTPTNRTVIPKPERSASPVAEAPGTSVSDTETPPASEPSPAATNQAKLTIGNLGQLSIDILIDGTVMATLPPGESQTLSLTAGNRALQVTGDRGKLSALRRITLHPGTARRLAFDDGPKRVDAATFHGGGRIAFREFLAHFAAAGVVTGLSFVFDTEEMDPLIFVGIFTLVWFGLTFFRMSTNNAKLVLSSEGIAFRRWSFIQPINKPIPWTTFDQVSLFGKGEDAALVVWHKKDASRSLPGEDLHGGTKICDGENIGVVNSNQLGELRSALKLFAGDVYVEQSA